MQPAASITAIRRAGYLIDQWNRADLHAVLRSLAEMRSEEDMKDVIAALLIMRNIPDDKVRSLTTKAAFQEVTDGW